MVHIACHNRLAPTISGPRLYISTLTDPGSDLPDCDRDLCLPLLTWALPADPIPHARVHWPIPRSLPPPPASLAPPSRPLLGCQRRPHLPSRIGRLPAVRCRAARCGWRRNAGCRTSPRLAHLTSLPTWLASWQPCCRSASRGVVGDAAAAAEGRVLLLILDLSVFNCSLSWLSIPVHCFSAASSTSGGGPDLKQALTLVPAS